MARFRAPLIALYVLPTYLVHYFTNNSNQFWNSDLMKRTCKHALIDNAIASQQDSITMHDAAVRRH